jgi:hypothetical protein
VVVSNDIAAALESTAEIVVAPETATLMYAVLPYTAVYPVNETVTKAEVPVARVTAGPDVSRFTYVELLVDSEVVTVADLGVRQTHAEPL